jgi:hypothetical protein
MPELSESDRAEYQRARALIAEVDEPVIPVSKLVYRVHSQSRGGYHTVARKQIGWVCDCGRFELLHTACKHSLAVRILLRPGAYHERNLRVPLSRPNYSQAWPAYDAAQQEEHSLFDPLLWDLLTAVPEPNREVRAKRRPPVPLRTQFLMSVKKVHVGESSRRARGLLKVIYNSGEGLIPCVPNYAVPSRLFNRPETGELLLDLIRLSARPLRDIEDGGTVAIDSTGFCTTCMGAYCTERHDPSRKHRWVKAHVIVGVRTRHPRRESHGRERGGLPPVRRVTPGCQVLGLQSLECCGRQSVPLIRELIHRRRVGAGCSNSVQGDHDLERGSTG